MERKSTGKGVRVREGRPILKEEKPGRLFDAVCQAMREGQFSEAIDLLEGILERDVERPGAASALKCAGFWKERLEQEHPQLDSFESGELLLGQWRLFRAFVERLADVPERCLFAIKQFIFSTALSFYLAAAPESEQGGDPDVLLQIGRCCKGTGNYERAIENLERANRERRDDPVIMAELADCYSLVNESRSAKAFFREALFVDPQAVDREWMESPLILRLAEKLSTRGFSGPALNEWLPVYGAIWGVLNVKREMKPLEFGKLKQAIYRLEKEYRGGTAVRDRTAPRLINRYIWLIDHYMSVGEPRERIEEVLQKIRDIDPGVHDEYTR